MFTLLAIWVLFNFTPLNPNQSMYIAENVYYTLTDESYKTVKEIPLYTPDLEKFAELYIFQTYRGNFYSVIVSLKKELPPVLEFGEGLYRPFLFKDKIEKKIGLKVYGKDTYLIYTGYSQFYINIRGKEQCYDVQFHRYTDYDAVRKKFIFSKLSSRYIKRNYKKWDQLINKSLQYFTQKQTNSIDSVPAFLWSYGCSPTSSAMIMAYWDKRGFGRLLDYYFDHYDVALDEWVNNVPNVQQELAVAMNTDTTTGGTSLSNIPSGHVTVANTYNNYNFSSSLLAGGTNYPYIFSQLKYEIDVGRPVHWAVINYIYQGDTINHSTCAIGYEITGSDTFVILHNTWDKGTWYWPLYTDGSLLYAYSVIPGGEIADNIFLQEDAPVIVHDLYSKIYYNIVGTSISYINLYVSYDNGITWDLWDTFNPDSMFIIRIQNPPDSVIRFMVKAFNTTGDELAAEGIEGASGIIFISDSSNLQVTGFDVSSGDLNSLQLRDSVLYVGTSAGIEQFNVQNDTLFEYIGNIFTEKAVYEMEADSSYIAASCFDKGFVIIKRDSVIFEDSTSSYVQDIDIDGVTVATFERGDGVRILDLEPTPTYRCTLSTSYFAMTGKLKGNHLFVGSVSDGVHLYDISQVPPQEILNFSSGRVLDMELDGNYLYVLHFYTLEVFDITDQLNPQPVTTLSLSGVQTIEAANNLVNLIKGNNGLDILQNNGDTLLPVAHIGDIGLVKDAIFNAAGDKVFFGTYGHPFYSGYIIFTPVEESNDINTQVSFKITPLVKSNVVYIGNHFKEKERVLLIDATGRKIAELHPTNSMIKLPLGLNRGLYHLVSPGRKKIFRFVKF